MGVGSLAFPVDFHESPSARRDGILRLLARRGRGEQLQHRLSGLLLDDGAEMAASWELREQCDGSPQRVEASQLAEGLRIEEGSGSSAP